MKNKKNILIATGIYPPTIGGPATYAKLMYDELKSQGFKVKVESFDDVRVYPKIIRHLIFCCKLFFASFGCQTIFVQDTVSVGLPALVVSKLMQKRMVLRVPGDYAWEQGTQRFGVLENIDEFQNIDSKGILWIIRKIQCLVAKNSDAVVVPSNYFKKVVLKWGVSEEIVNVIYNGIESIDIPEKHLKNNNDFVIVSAGRLVPWKGFSELIINFKKIKKSIPYCKLVIAGDGPCKQELIDLVNREKLSDSVTITGVLSRKKLFEIMANSDIFVLNSSFESFSFQVVEALALGCVVVSTDSGSLVELIENNISGVLYKNGDNDEFIELVVNLLNDPVRRESISKSAIIRSKNFSFSTTIFELKKIL